MLERDSGWVDVNLVRIVQSVECSYMSGGGV